VHTQSAKEELPLSRLTFPKARLESVRLQNMRLGLIEENFLKLSALYLEVLDHQLKGQ
jgi:hypothetical protein